MTTPKICGYPFWINMKSRVAKKYLNKWSIGRFMKPELQNQFLNLKIGDIVNDCTGFNGRILKITPSYECVGKGRILSGIDFQTENTRCCLISCGVEVGVSQSLIEEKYIKYLEKDFFTEENISFYEGKDAGEYSKKHFAMEKLRLEVLKSGNHITNELGILLPEYKVS